MAKDSRRLYVFCDMEGASQISPGNAAAMRHGSDAWRDEGRAWLTSDLLAVCEAAREAGVDKIIVNDAHDVGKRRPNLLVDRLPRGVRVLGRPHLPGKARRLFREDPWGIVMIGQHAMYGAEGFAPHTIQSPPIGRVAINGLAVSEMGIELALFHGSRVLAVVGDAAAVREAEALCPGVRTFAVKDSGNGRFPTAADNFHGIKATVTDAIVHRVEAPSLELAPPFRVSMEPAVGWRFDQDARFPGCRIASAWFRRLYGGRILDGRAEWSGSRLASCLSLVYMMRMFLVREGRT